MVPQTARLAWLAGSLLAAACVTEETPRVTQIRITPSSRTIQPGGSVALVAEALDGQGNLMSGRVAAWASRTPAIATVGPTTGLVTGLVPGIVEIGATVDGVTGIAMITVAYPSPQVSTVRVEPGSAALRTGQDRLFIATPLDADGNPIPGRSPRWQSTAPEVATVSAAGLVTAVGPGQAVIIAWIDDRTGGGTVDVSPRAASVELEGRSQLDYVADTVKLNAVVRDGDGAVIPGWPVRWSSSDPDVVRVSSSGTMSSVGLGTAVITAASENSSAVLPVTVTRLAVAQVSIVPGISAVFRNRLIGLTAIPATSDGQKLKGRATTWTTGNPAVATVNADGVVSGLATGTAVITALVEGISAQVSLQVVESSAPSLSLGYWHSCSVAGSGEVYCWGQRPAAGTGQDVCYDVTYYDSPFSCIQTPRPVAEGSQLVSVTAGQWHSCGLTAAGAAWCWGSNGSGVLGLGLPWGSEAPVPVSGGHSFASLTAGSFFTCGLTSNGQAWCWGRNADGQLGNGTMVEGASPTPVLGGHTFARLSAGESHVCGITVQSGTFCWGDNGSGQLGDGTFVDRKLPVEVVTAQAFVVVDAGTSHSCGLTAAGAAHCWGNAYGGTLGDGSSANRTTPGVVSGGHQWLSIDAGIGNTCGVRIDGTGWCWGNNYFSRLGDGTTTNRTTPTQVAGSVNFTEIAGGWGHTCGRSVGGAVYCWGLGMTGSLGLGPDVADRLVPTRVLGSP